MAGISIYSLHWIDSSCSSFIYLLDFFTPNLLLDSSLAFEWSINTWNALRPGRKQTTNSLWQEWELPLLARMSKNRTSLGTTQTTQLLAISLVKNGHKHLYHSWIWFKIMHVLPLSNPPLQVSSKWMGICHPRMVSLWMPMLQQTLPALTGLQALIWGYTSLERTSQKTNQWNHFSSSYFYHSY